MGTIKCPSCGRPVSTDLELGHCPHCGCPASRIFSTSKIELILTLAFIALIVIGCYFGSKDESKAKHNNVDAVESLEQVKYNENRASEQNMSSSSNSDIIKDEVISKEKNVNDLFESNNIDEPTSESSNITGYEEEQVTSNNFENDSPIALKETKESKKERKRLEKEKKKMEKERKKMEKERLKQEKKKR